MNKITDETIKKNLTSLKNSIILPNSLTNLNHMNKRQKKTRVLPKVILATSACFLLIFYISNTTAFSETFQKIFQRFTVDQGVENAILTNNGINRVNKSVENNNIKLTINGVISDGVRTVLSVRFDSDIVYMDHVELKGVSLSDNSGRVYEMSAHGAGETIKGSKSYNTSIEFYGSPTEDTTLNLEITSINNITGKWGLEFNVNPTIAKEYIAKGSYSNSEIDMNVTKVTFSSTYTIVEGSIKGRDINFVSTLTNSNDEEAKQISGERTKDGNFKLYFSPLIKTDKLTIRINTIEDNAYILSTDIDIRE